MDEQREKAQRIADEAAKRSIGDRTAFIREQCGDDTELLSHVESLLEGATIAAEKTPIGSSAAIVGSHDPGTTGDRIGPYRILEQLGEGGMGVVYLAERTEPFQQRVALKIIKPGMDSKVVIARFEAERQALARMDHPNIARVLDAGVTDRGLPYFVMEYIKGEPITIHADKARLNVEERLELFIAVCEAVQHAHHKGVIHRDLKPSNILVALEGTRRIAKVIDFGVARATDQTRSGDLFTRHGGPPIGTLEYMSPEQAEMGAADIDTRTDVYALGVVLYQLLTGVLPFERDTFYQASQDAMQRIIREVDPPIPSRRLRSLAPSEPSTLGDISKARGVDARRLTRLLRNDLDWVVMKCLEKRRERRYDTPSALALDLQRFLAGQTVLTGPPSVTYHFSKFYRRHRGAMTAAGLILAALIGGFVLTYTQWQRAEAREAELRQLAGSLINEFHEKVVPLPGSLRARETLVSLGTTYLERQNDRAGDSEELLLDVATGYDFLGDAEAGLRTPHRGDINKALSFYQIASDIRSELQDDAADPDAVLQGLSQSQLRFGDMRREQGRLDESLAAYRTGLTYLDSLSSGLAGSPEAVISRALLEVALANVLGRINAKDEERPALLRAAESRLALLMTSDSRDEVRQAHARALHNLGEWYLLSKRDGNAAFDRFQRAATLRRALFESDPVNVLKRRALAASLVLATQCTRDPNVIVPLSEEAITHFRFMTQADPSDQRAWHQLARTLGAVGRLERANAARAIELLEQGVRAGRTSLDLMARPTAEASEDVAQLELMLAIRLDHVEQHDGALDSARASFDRYEMCLRETRSHTMIRWISSSAEIQIKALSTLEGVQPTQWQELADQINGLLLWIDDKGDAFEASRADINALRAHAATCEQALASGGS